MTPAEASRLFDGADLDTREGRQALRERLVRLRLAGRIGSVMYRDALAAIDGAAKDQDRAPKSKAPPTFIVESPYAAAPGRAEESSA